MTSRLLLGVGLGLSVIVGGVYVQRHLAPPTGARAIGGGWYATDPQSVFAAGHSSVPYQRLYRRNGRWYTRVSSSVVRLRYYGSDCVVFQAIYPTEMIWAACGDRSPIAILSTTSSSVFQFEDEGLVDHDVGATFVKPIERILTLARAQPPYRSGWSEGYRDDRSVDAVASVER